MSTIYKDTRKAVVGIVMEQGCDKAAFDFPSGNPKPSTLNSIVGLMVDGYKLADVITVPLNELPTESDHE